MKRMKPGLLFTCCLIAVAIGFPPAFSSQPEDKVAVTHGAKVTLAFTITIPEEQEVLPDTVSEYIQGKDPVLPKLEEAVAGMKPGERKRIDLQPDEAFGEHDEQKMVRVGRNELPPTARAGAIYQTFDGEPFRIVALSDDAAILDFNHPLAGKHLILDVEILQVDEPT